MEKPARYSRILFVSLCTCFFLTPGVCAELNGYTVGPVTSDMDTGVPLETVPVDFWDLPPGITLLALALSVSSFIGFPVELFFIIKLYTYLGYRKITRDTVLHNETRNRIFSCLQDNPGINYTKLIQMTGVNRGTLYYHLLALKMMGKITVVDARINPRYFENSGLYSETEKTVLKHIRNDTDNRILRVLLEKPVLTRIELSEILTVSPSTISWRMKRLADDELICTRKCGKNVHYMITPDTQQYLEKYLVRTGDTTTPAVPGDISEPA